MRVLVVALSVVVAGMALGPASAADEVIACERDAMVRTIRIVAQPEAGRACEVQYQRSSSSAPAEVLWHAANDASFCASQAETLVSRLAAGGWSCQPAAEDSVSAQEMANVPELPEPLSAPIEVAEPTPQGVTAATERQPAIAKIEAPQQPNNDVAAQTPVLNPMFKLRPTIH